MTTPAVPFVYADWVAAFPLFAGINSADAQSYFDTAGMFCANDTCSQTFALTIAYGTGTQPLLTRLLWLLTCHLAYLGAFRDASGNPSSSGTVPPSPLVGRVSAATEGSVNVSVDLDTSGYPIPAFWQQTTWGLQFWQATAQFRTGIYVANPTVIWGGAYPLVGSFGRRGLGRVY